MPRLRSQRDPERQTAVARLRASKRQHESEVWQQGRGMGRRWAAKSATYAQLMRLSEQSKAFEGNLVARYSRSPATTPGGDFVFDIEPDEGGDSAFAHVFWEDQLDSETRHLAEDAGFVAAFAQGAVEFFRAIEDEL